MQLSFKISSPFSLNYKPTSTHRTNQKITVRAQATEPRKENIVIVGAGIAGLATAVSLQRLGVDSLVIERTETIQTGGTSLALFKNGWRVLDSLGIGDELRPQFIELEELQIKSTDGRDLRKFRMKEDDPRYAYLHSERERDRRFVSRQEVRGVERRKLLETLASKLPGNAIRFSSALENLETRENGETLLSLADGTRVLAKVVIGCDGTGSSVAKWMGFPEARYVGHRAYRGIGEYPNGHPFDAAVNYVYGRGIRAGYVPVSPKNVYWFICHNSETPGKRERDPRVLKEEAKGLMRGWPRDLIELIERSPDDTMSRVPLVDRWLWPMGRSGWKGNAVLVGDAWHPMTPNLAQGACCALEDAVVLAGKLAAAAKEGGKVDEAFRAYESERRGRIFRLAVKSNLVGSLLQWENALFCGVRDSILIPRIARLGPMLEHTNFEIESR